MNLNVSPSSKIENKYALQNKKQPSFKGMEAAANYFFSQVQTNEVFGATVVDFISMIAPRTAVDMTRSPQAGIETARREASGAVINCLMPGFVGMGTGWLLGKFISPELKVNTSMPIDSNTAKMLNSSWKAAGGHNFYEATSNKTRIVQKYVENVLGQTEGLVGEEWVKLSGKTKTIKELSGQIADLIVNEKLPKNEIKKSLEEVKNRTVQVLGASESIRIGGEKGFGTTIDRLYSNMHSMGTEIFTKAKSSKESESFVEKFLKVNPKKTAIALSVVAVIGLAQQAVNRYLTKKKTGSDAFVGLSEEGKAAEKPDKNAKSKLIVAKIVSSVAILGIAASAIAGSIKPKVVIEAFKPQNLVKKLEFNGKWPNINQLKAVYSAMIVGRMLAATDKHELRETDTRDIPGFLNWLVLGGFVSKYVGKKISDGKIINSSTPLAKGASLGAKVQHFLGSESLISHAEIEARKGLDVASKKLLKTKLNISILAGLAYSTLALGVFMPMLNKHITDKLTAKKKPEDTPITADNNPSIKT